jgi:alkylation response protein AidB-like acyl-CoA dehydrogenase
MNLAGLAAQSSEGEAAAWSASFLFNRCLTIAGGTSDIQRNVIAERLLGLPRDP